MLLSILTSAITGLAIALSAAPWDLFPFAFIALIPWLRYLNSNPSFSETLKSSLWTGFFMALGTFSWISFVLNSFGGVPWILAIPMTLLFAIGAEPQFVIFGLLRRLLKKSNFTASPILWAFSSAFLYTAIDFLVPKLFKDTLGHSLHSNLPFLQNAEWGGAHALTFMLVFFNESAVQALQSKKIKQMIAPIALASALYSFGLIRLPQIQNYYLENGKSITVAGIQGNIGDFDKLAAEQGVRDAADRVMSIFRTMTNQALLQTPKADLVIWPETTYPSTFGLPYTQNEARRDLDLTYYAEDIGRPILFGGYDRKDQLDYNAFFFLEPKTIDPKIGNATTKTQVYHKHILLYFGEEMPFSDTFPILKTWFPQVANFGRGPGPEVFSIRIPNRYETIKISPVICYEALFPEFVLKAANNGAQILINATNDSWFGPWGEPELHYSVTKFRSVEARIPQVRVTNSGISGVILPTGDTQGQTKTFVPVALHETFPYVASGTAPMTLMKRFPNGFAWLSVLISLALFGFSFRKLYKF